MSTLIRASKLIDNCTPSISYDPQVKSACESIDRQCYEIIDDTGQIIMIPNIMGLTDETLVDILAWQFHVDFYDKTRDLEFRKRLVQMSIIWHKTKGTVALVEEVINTYWPGSAYLEEWFDYKNPLPPGLDPLTAPAIPYSTIQSPPIAPPVVPSWHDRYRFRVVINDAIVDPEVEAQVMTLIDRYKPISRWPEPNLRPRASSTSVYVAGYALIFTTRISNAPPIPTTS
jgi:P2-related tail formation protein